MSFQQLFLLLLILLTWCTFYITGNAANALRGTSAYGCCTRDYLVCMMFLFSVLILEHDYFSSTHVCKVQ